MKTIITVPTYQNQTQVHLTQTQHQQLFTQTLLPYSGVIASTLLPQTPFMTTPPRRQKLESLNNSNQLNFSTTPVNFASTSKASNFRHPQQIHTESHVNKYSQNISLVSISSSSGEPLSLNISSPIFSSIASNPFCLLQGQISNNERWLSQTQWNRSFKIVNPSPPFQNLLPLSFHGTPSFYSKLNFGIFGCRRTLLSVYWQTARQNRNLPHLTYKT